MEGSSNDGRALVGTLRMIYGDLVTIAHNGIRIPPQVIRPVGLHNRSRCWGVWVPEVTADASGGEVKSDRTTRPSEPAHLVVSPFHPVSWPYLVRLELKIRHDKGTLARASDILRKQRINILHEQCSQTGFQHLTWEVVGEATEVRKKFQDRKEQLDRKFPSFRAYSINRKAYELARPLANEIAEAMFTKAKSLATKLEPAGANEFLHKRIVNKEQYLYDRFQLPKFLRSYADSKLENAIVSDWLFHLPFFAIYGGGSDVPISMQYDAESELLRFTDPRSINYKDNLVGLLPTLGIASCNTSEYFVRIVPIRKRDLSRRFSEIEVAYKAGATANRTGGEAIGLFHQICEEANRSNINLVYVSTRHTEFSYHNDLGRLLLIGEFTEEPPDLDSARRQLESRLLQIDVTSRARATDQDSSQECPTIESSFADRATQDVAIVRAHVGPCRIGQVFVSMRFQHPRHEAICDTVKRCAARAGFQAKIVTTHTEEVTRTITSSVAESVAFLQLLMFRAEDDPDHTDLAWLDFEFGIATGRNLARIRLVDIVRRPYKWWLERLGTDRDRYVKPFRTDVNDKELERAIQEAIDALTPDEARWREQD